MMASSRSWVYYMYSGILAITLSWVVTGCRYGNRVTKTVISNNPDTFSGYYESQPQNLLICTNHGETECARTTTNLIPPLISSVITNPVAFVVKNWNEGVAYLAAPSGESSAIPLLFDKQGTLYFLGTTAEEPLWDDPRCTTSMSIEADGFLDQNDKRSVSGTPLDLSGRIRVKIQVVTRIQGSCELTYSQLRNCYENVDYCGTSDRAKNENYQRAIQEMFNPYINAGTLRVDDIGKVKALSYEVEYE